MSAVRTLSRRTGVDPRVFGGLSVILAGLAIWGLAFTGVLSTVFSSGPAQTIRADFPTIEAIVKGDPVRIDGVQVGTVSAESEDANHKGATLTMNLGSNAGKIYADARASILWRTLLGANDAVSLNPGTPGAGLLGSREIPMSQDSSQVELDQITQGILHGQAQQGLRTLLQQTAPALSVSPQVGIQDFGTLSHIAPEAATGVGALRGVVPDTDLKSFVRQTARTVSAIDVGANAATTGQFVQTAASTLDALSASQADLRATIDDAGTVLPALTVTARRVNATLTQIDPLVRHITAVAPQVAPAVGALHPTVVDASTVLKRATPLLDKLPSTVSALTDASDTGEPLINNLQPTLTRLIKVVDPGLLAPAGPEEKGYNVVTMLMAALSGLGDASAGFDQDSFLIALGFNEGVDTESAQILPCTEDFAGNDLLVCQSLADSLGTLFSGGTSVLKSLRSSSDKAGLASTLPKSLNTSIADVERMTSQLGSVKTLLQKADPAAANVLFHQQVSKP